MTNGHITVIWCDWGDSDTAGLQRIWQGVHNTDIIHITQWNDVMETCVELTLRNESDTLLLCGHGTSDGLLAPNSFSEYVVHECNAGLIHAQNVIGLFCHASSFAEPNGLHGLFSSMFISNVREAEDHCVRTTGDEIRSCNNLVFNEIRKVLCDGISLDECLSGITTLRNTTEFPVMEFNSGGMVIL